MLLFIFPRCTFRYYFLPQACAFNFIYIYKRWRRSKTNMKINKRERCYFHSRIHFCYIYSFHQTQYALVFFRYISKQNRDEAKHLNETRENDMFLFIFFNPDTCMYFQIPVPTFQEGIENGVEKKMEERKNKNILMLSVKGERCMLLFSSLDLILFRYKHLKK